MKTKERKDKMGEKGPTSKYEVGKGRGLGKKKEKKNQKFTCGEIEKLSHKLRQKTLVAFWARQSHGDHEVVWFIVEKWG